MARLEYTLSRKPGKSALDRAYMEALRDDVEFGDAEWRFRQHMTGEHGATLVFYDEAEPVPNWRFEASSVPTRIPGIAPAPTVDTALVQHPDGSLWAVAWRGNGWSLPRPTFFSPAFTPDPACWERRVLGHWDESEGA